MRTLYSTILLLATVLTCNANELLKQLADFNPYWCQYQEALQGKPSADLPNDQAYVQTHLSEVLLVLNAAETARLTHAQREMRTTLVQQLQEYAEQGCFPRNYYKTERIPVFVDEHNTHCAVGYLMRHTGHEEMAQRIAASNNYAWVREIKDEALLDWQYASGFSLDELKLIQGAYDFYMEDAFLLPNKYEVPQKPEQVVRYFENDKNKIWCYGAGQKGDLHGQWVQNYSSELPWIVGYFEHGKRSGRWKEYYKGTNKLCRTEHWRNDKLNGVRTRYDREGKVIETIMFKDGKAVTKINMDHEKALRWKRSPIDGELVFTEILTEEGALIAAGKERIHNPEGLAWFQNIELTALNTFAIAARDGAPQPEQGIFVNRFDMNSQFNQLPGSRTLVEYRKEGKWVYYKDYLNVRYDSKPLQTRAEVFCQDYAHFGTALYKGIELYDELKLEASYDSMQVVYDDNKMEDFYGYTQKKTDHLVLSYHEPILTPAALFHAGSYRLPQLGNVELERSFPVKSIARRNEDGALVGVRAHYNRQQQLQRIEQFLIPYKEEEEDLLGVIR